MRLLILISIKLFNIILKTLASTLAYSVMGDSAIAQRSHTKEVKAWMENNLDGSIHQALNTSVPGVSFNEEVEQYIAMSERVDEKVREGYGKKETIDL